jgi:tetratricopeptide (TPR) repeat protein
VRRHCCWLALAVLVSVASCTPAPALGVAAHSRQEVIRACYGGSDGRELHVTLARRRCRPGERELSWNRQGRPGKNGSAGGSSKNWSFNFSSHNDNTTWTLNFSSGGGNNHHKSVWTWIKDAVPALGNALLLLGLGALALAILLWPVNWLASTPLKWPWLWRRRIFQRFGPALQIQPFEDGAMTRRLGTSFALLAQARIDGGRDTGMHLYLVTGEERTGDALADVQAVPQAQALAAALSLMRFIWRRRRLTVSGALFPVDGRETAAVAVSLKRNSTLVETAEFWLTEPPTPKLSPSISNRVLAVAAAGWIEHTVIDQTPGPRARELLLSRDPRSWALFRAGSEMSRISLLDEAADLYERALAIDRDNIGALVDLAHLRRRAGHFDGADALALDAIELIERRNAKYGRWQNDEDPNWYRAQIVLATTYAECSKHLGAEGADAGDAQTAADAERKKAFDLAATIVCSAASTTDRLEEIVGAAALRKAEEGEALSRRVRWRAWARARPKGRRFEGSHATELHMLLATTFEPGAFLLVAANVASPPTLHLPVRATDQSGDARHKALVGARGEALAQLEHPESLDPQPVIDYVDAVPLKSPRVVYNLACFYSINSDRADDGGRMLKRALDLLRESLSRTPPMERRGLFERAQRDPDLEALRDAYGFQVESLRRLVPDQTP